MRIRNRTLAGMGLASALLHGCAIEPTDAESPVETQVAALSTAAVPYLEGAARGVTLTPLLTVGDSVNNKPDGTPYRMVGIPDGLGAFDNDDGTFTLLMNHELTNPLGVQRAHGAIGAFVSKWRIDKDSLRVLEGSDLIQSISTYNPTTGAWNEPAKGINLGRLCSADLPEPSAFYNKLTRKGFKGHIFMDGEETGAEGRALAHVVDGEGAGISYELPHLGKLSWENSLAHGDTGDTTLVAGMDDSGGGQVYFYVGQKKRTGLPIDKAGLTGGNLYALALDGIASETDATVLAAPQKFSLVSLGNVANLTGAALQTATVAAGATGFQRPEDGSWNPDDNNEFFFVTTASFTNKTRLWRLRFKHISNPALGGEVDLLVDGGEPRMMDNITVDRKGRFVTMCEDPGGNDHLAKVWRYDLRNDELKLIAQHNPDLFAVPAGENFVTNDEESSGVVDVSKILGNGHYLIDVQAHKASADPELVEGGQLLLMRVPNRLR